jgi:hypothetical protein
MAGKGGKFKVSYNGAGYGFVRNVFAKSEWHAVLKAFRKEGVSYNPRYDEKNTSVRRLKVRR